MIKTQSNQYDSSTIESSEYNFDNKKLCIIFKHATYVYLEVEYEDYFFFSTAESQGIALNTYIKGKYVFTKVDLKMIDNNI
jgi:hypothetical protein